MGITQKELAKRVHCDYQNLNKCIHNGYVTEIVLDLIGRELDLTPDYLTGDLWEPMPYSFYQTAVKFSEGDVSRMMNDLVDHLIFFSFLRSEDKEAMRQLSGDEKKEMLFRAVHAADAYYMEVMTGKEV